MAKTRRAVDDVNGQAAGLLQDLAAIQVSKEKRLAYRRAAAAVLDLERPLRSLVSSGGVLEKIPAVGPSSTRVILEFLTGGSSATVDRAVAESGKAQEITERRALRRHFFSRAAVRQILDNHAGSQALRLQGDLQVHSEWSDGVPSVGELAAAALARGYSYLAVTDHSFGLPIAGGVSMAQFAEQHREIDAVNREYVGRFRLLKGVEANIGADGALDVGPEDRRRFEIVLAAPHSQLRVATDQTARLMAAVESPGVHVLAHPRGRQAGTRGGIVADWSKVFKAAARANVAVEIDGDPFRQDLDYELAAGALAAGCLFALDSDAHRVGELHYTDTAVAHALLAGIPARRIINCWSATELLTWLNRQEA